MPIQPVVYILASERNGTLYIGVTNNLARRIYEHKSGLIEGFTKRYKVKLLVYYEIGASMRDAIAREKQLKGMSRLKKLKLIEQTNPDWNDISKDLS